MLCMLGLKSISKWVSHALRDKELVKKLGKRHGFSMIHSAIPWLDLVVKYCPVLLDAWYGDGRTDGVKIAITRGPNWGWAMWIKKVTPQFQHWSKENRFMSLRNVQNLTFPQFSLSIPKKCVLQEEEETKKDPLFFLSLTSLVAHSTDFHMCIYILSVFFIFVRTVSY